MSSRAQRWATNLLILALLAPNLALAQRYEVRREVREGTREVNRERREAARELRRCDTRECARQEVREGYREVNREKREARREIRREIREERRDQYWRSDGRYYRDGRYWDRYEYERRYYGHYRRDDDKNDLLKGILIGAAVVGVTAAVINSQNND